MNGQSNGRSVVQRGLALQPLAERRADTRLRFDSAVSELVAAARELCRSDYCYAEALEERLRASGGMR